MLNLEVDVQKSQQDIKKLGDEILELGTKAETAGKAINNGLKLKKSALDDVVAMKKEFQAWSRTMGTFKSNMVGAKSVIEELAGSSLKVINATNKANALIKAQATAIKEQSSATKELASDTEKLSQKEKERTALLQLEAKVIAQTMTAQQRYNSERDKLAKIESRLNPQQYARALEMTKSLLTSTGLEVERYTARLQKQNAEFGKSKVQLLTLKEGWSLLSAEERKVAVETQEVANSMANVKGLIEKTLSPVEQYNQRVKDLTRLSDLYSRSNKEMGISQSQYTQGLKNARAELDAFIAKQDKASIALNRKSGELKESKTSLLSYIESMKETALNVARTDIEILKLTRGFSALSPAEQQAAIAARQLATDMGIVKGVIQGQVTPLQNYRNGLEALERLYKQGAVSTQQYRNAQVGLKAELEKNIKSQFASAGSLSHLSNEFRVGAQATAAFRAGLMGANLGFGIFTSSTIAVATVMYGFTKAMRGALTVGSSFEKTFDRVAVVLGQFGENIGDTGISNEVDLVKRKVLELGETTQFTANQVAEAAATFAQAGLSGIQIYNALPGALNLAAIGMIEVSEAADIASNVMYAFGKEAKDIDRIVDTLARTTVDTNLTITEVAKTMTYVGASARMAGMSIEQAASAFSVLANVGIKGSMAGTVLRRVITNIATATPAVTKEFGKLGIDIKSMTKSGIDLSQIFTLLNQKMQGMTKVDKIAALKAIFGQWAVSGSAGLTLLADRLGKFEIALSSSAGTAEQMRKALQDNLAGAYENLTSVIENIGIKAFDVFGPGLTAKVKEFAKYLNANTEQIAATIAKVANALSAIISFFVEWSGTIAKTVVAFTAFKVVQSLMAGVLGTIEALSIATAAYTTKTILSGVATTTLGTASKITSGFLVAETVGLTAATRAKNIDTVATKANATAKAAGLVGVGRFATALGWLGRVLSGPWGFVAITALTLGISYLTSGMAETEKQTYKASDALKEYSMVATELDQLSFTNLTSIGTRLDEDLSVAKAALAEMDAEIERLKERGKERIGLQNYASPELRVTGTAAIEALTKAETEAISKSHEYAIVQYEVKRAIEARNAVAVQASAQFLSEKYGLETAASAFSSMNQHIQTGTTLLNSFNGGMFTFNKLAKTSQGIADALALMQDKIKLEAEVAAAEAKAEENTRKNVSALESYIKEYEKAIGSTAEFTRGLRDLATTQTFLTSGSPAAAAALKTLGYTAAEAKEALNWKQSEISKDYLIQTIAGVDVRFKDLSKTMGEVQSQTLTTAEAEKFLNEAIAQLPKSAQAAATALKGPMLEAIEAVNNGSKKLKDEFKKLEEEAALLQAKWASPTGFDALVGKFKEVGGATTELVIATIRAGQVFGDMTDTMTEDEKLSEAARLVKILGTHVGVTGVTAAKAAKMMQRLTESLPTGALLKENENISNQIMLMGQGADALELYNAAWEATGGHLDKVRASFITAKKENIELQNTLKQIQEVQGIYEQFGESTARLFTDLFTGGIKSFKSFASRLKDMFKQLIADLLFTAIKNNIFKAMFNTGNGGGNIFSSVIQGIAGLFGGGRPAGQAGGQSGGMWSNLAGTIGSFFSGTQQTSSSPAQTGGMNFGSLVGTALTSLVGGGAGAAGSGTGAAWLSMVSGAGNGFNPQQLMSLYQSYFSSPAVSGLGALGVPMANAGMGAVSAFGPWSSGYMAASPTVSLGYGTIPNYTGAATSITGAAPTSGALGVAGTAMAGISGAYYGYNRTNGGAPGVAAGVGYGALGIGVAGTVAGMAGGATAGAAAGGAFGAFGASAAVPVIGWIIAAIALLDLATGGKVFGTKFRTESASGGINIGEEGGTAFTNRREVRQRSLFGGRQWRTVNMRPSDEARDAAESAANDIRKTMEMTAKELEVINATMIDASFTTTKTYNKKGKETGETTSAVIEGRTYKGIDFEEFMKRSHAEQMLKVVDKSVQAMFEGIAETAVSEAADVERAVDLIGSIEDPEDGRVGRIGNPGGSSDLTSSLSEVQQLAERWRSNADLLLEGAQLLVVAQNDIIDGNGLLGPAYRGILTDTVDLVEELQKGGEGLADAYQRIKQSTALVQQTLSGFGVNIGKNREELLRFSTDLVESLGGLDAASAKLNEFVAAFGELAGLGDYQAVTSRNTRNARLEALGLDVNIDSQEFSHQFRLALPTMDAEDVGQWIEAGQALAVVHNALEEMRKQAELIEDPIQQVRDQVEGQIESIRRMGASETELAQARVYGQAIIEKALEAQRKELADFMNGIEGELAKFEGREHVYQIEQIRLAYVENDRRARSLGASTSQLARIQQLAAYQIQQVIAELRMSITNLVSQLYGSEVQNQIDATAQTNSSYYDSLQQEASDLYDLEMERYRAAQDAIKQIDQYLRDLQAGPLSTGGWQERLGASEANFMDMFRRAMEGDPEAMSELTNYANEYLQQAQDAYGPSTQYASIFDTVTAMLRQFRAYAATIAEPTAPVTNTDSGGGGSGSTSTSSNGLLDAAARYQLSLQLAQQIGELGLALDVSVFDLMEEFGVDIEKLAFDLGINVDSFSANMATNLAVMAGALGVSISEIVTELGITAEQIATAFEITAGDYSQTNIEAMMAMAESFGIDIFEAMSLIGVDLSSVAESFGVDLDALSLGMGERLIALADLLGVSLTDLSSSLGLSISDLALSFGIDVDSLNSTTVERLTALSDVLGIGLGELIGQLGISMADLAISFGVDIANMSATTVTQLTALATSLDINIGELIDELGINIEDLAVAFGVDLTSLSGDMYDHFTEFANTLGMDIFALADRLGLDLDAVSEQFATVLTERLEALPDIPDDIRDLLEPLLSDIFEADSSAEVNTAVGNLIASTRLIPEATREQLLGLFTSLGVDVASSVYSTGVTQLDAAAQSLAVQNTIADNTLNTVTAIGQSATDIIAAITASGTTAAAIVITGMEEGFNYLSQPGIGMPAEYEQTTGSPTEAYLESRVSVTEEQVASSLRASQDTADKVKEVEQRIVELTDVIEKASMKANEAQEKTNEQIDNLARAVKRNSK